MKFDREILQVLCPYGKWRHAKGMQIVDEEAAKKMGRAAIGNAIFPIPIYVGHPDEDNSAKARAVGRIKRIIKTRDGIAVLAAYPQKTYDEIVGGKYAAMSPRWKMQNIGGGNYRPVKLISVGLTNNPNIAESGKILGFGRPHSRDAEALGDASKRISKAATGVSECAKRAAELDDGLRRIGVSERMRARKKSEENRNTPKRDCATLAEMARERSRRLGEPYTKSFAEIKKRHLNGQ